MKYSTRDQFQLFQSQQSIHIHIVLKLRTRDGLRNFLREFAGFLGLLFRIAGGLFAGRPFSRIVEWGRDYFNINLYLRLNEWEKIGISKDTGREIMWLME